MLWCLADEALLSVRFAAGLLPVAALGVALKSFLSTSRYTVRRHSMHAQFSRLTRHQCLPPSHLRCRHPASQRHRRQVDA